MTIRSCVQVGQLWQSNDPRRFAIVEVVRIFGKRGDSVLDRFRPKGVKHAASLILDPQDEEMDDKVLVRNLVTKRHTTIRRDQFATGPRGWSLYKEVQRDAA